MFFQHSSKSQEENYILYIPRMEQERNTIKVQAQSLLEFILWLAIVAKVDSLAKMFINNQCGSK